MADDDEKAHDWDPEREKRQTDPEALARSFVRAAAEEQKKIDNETRKERAARDPDYPAYLCGVKPQPMDLQLSVHKIRNGFVVTYGQGPHGHPLTIDLAETEYAKDAAGALGVVFRITNDFLAGTTVMADPGPLRPLAGFGEYPPPPPPLD